MPNNISLKSLELVTTLRVLSNRLVDRKSCQYKTAYYYREVLEQCMFALENILIERGLNKEFWARIRGDRLFLFYLPLKRIGIEVRTVTDDAPGIIFVKTSICNLLAVEEKSCQKQSLI